MRIYEGMYQKILVPFDGSRSSISALRHANELAELVGDKAEITLLYVIDSIILPPMTHSNVRSRTTGEVIDREGILKEIYYSEKKTGKIVLENAAKSAHVTRKIKTELSYGSPPEKIVEFAKKHKIDLIVVGNIGLSGLSKLRALGSVSRCISECSPCPVLIVH